MNCARSIAHRPSRDDRWGLAILCCPIGHWHVGFYIKRHAFHPGSVGSSEHQKSLRVCTLWHFETSPSQTSSPTRPYGHLSLYADPFGRSIGMTRGATPCRKRCQPAGLLVACDRAMWCGFAGIHIHAAAVAAAAAAAAAEITINDDRAIAVFTNTAPVPDVSNAANSVGMQRGSDVDRKHVATRRIKRTPPSYDAPRPPTEVLLETPLRTDLQRLVRTLQSRRGGSYLGTGRSAFPRGRACNVRMTPHEAAGLPGARAARNRCSLVHVLGRSPSRSTSPQLPGIKSSAARRCHRAPSPCRPFGTFRRGGRRP